MPKAPDWRCDTYEDRGAWQERPVEYSKCVSQRNATLFQDKREREKESGAAHPTAWVVVPHVPAHTRPRAPNTGVAPTWWRWWRGVKHAIVTAQRLYDMVRAATSGGWRGPSPRVARVGEERSTKGTGVVGGAECHVALPPAADVSAPPGKRMS